MRLKIVTIPNPILTKKTSPITKIDDSILKLAEDMIETCESANGLGLAATQVGQSLRICVINLRHMGLPPFVLINPKIVKKSLRKIELEEGCLSVPGVFGMVKRPKKIKVRSKNLLGQSNLFDADGILARVIQHEVDHLDGVLFTEKILRRTDGKKAID